MKDLEISRQLKGDIETNQNQLKNAIRNHQIIVKKLKDNPENLDVQKELNKAEENIVIIGLEQKNLLERLRDEYKAHQKTLKATVVKNGIEERRNNLSNSLNRARKQNIAITRSASATSFSDDSLENAPFDLTSSPERKKPINPHDVSQTEFLTYFSLSTHEVYKEMLNKRAERKRRSTANPQFLYGNRGWDWMSTSKRKRNAYLVSAMSPPHTRQSTKRKNEKSSPPSSQSVSKTPTQSQTKEKERTSPVLETSPLNGGVEVQPIFSNFPAIPNLPSGLIIERVSPGSTSPDSRSCIKCRQPGALTICEICSNGFHVSCHNRPLTQTPRQCPKCISKEVRTVGALNVPSGMTVSCINPSEVSGDVTEKIKEKQSLQVKNESLNAELSLLQERHSELTISLKTQQTHQEQLLETQQSTEDKIQQILNFISTIKNPLSQSPE